jgi:hypothetical protein
MFFNGSFLNQQLLVRIENKDGDRTVQKAVAVVALLSTVISDHVIFTIDEY